MADVSWERYFNKTHPNLIERYDHTVGLVQPPSVLDVGCAQGLLARLLCTHRLDIIRVVGLDNDNHVLTEMQNIHELLGTELVHGVAEDLPFNDGEFSTVVMSEILEHVTDVAKSALEGLRVLSADGLLIASVPADEATPIYPHLRVFRDLRSLQMLFNSQIRWLGGKHLHRWYYTWGQRI